MSAITPPPSNEVTPPPSNEELTADQRSLSAIVSNETRSGFWSRLSEDTLSPAQLAREFGLTVNNAAYHVKVLVTLGAVELLYTEPSRGSIQHFYRSIKRPYISEEGYAKMSLDERHAFARHVLQLAFADATHALTEGTFSARPEHYVTRIPMRLDQRGFRKLATIYAEAFSKVEGVRIESEERLAESGEKPIPTTAILTFFETPSAERPPEVRIAGQA